MLPSLTDSSQKLKDQKQVMNTTANCQIVNNLCAWEDTDGDKSENFIEYIKQYHKNQNCNQQLVSTSKQFRKNYIEQNKKLSQLPRQSSQKQIQNNSDTLYQKKSKYQVESRYKAIFRQTDSSKENSIRNSSIKMNSSKNNKDDISLNENQQKGRQFYRFNTYNIIEMYNRNLCCGRAKQKVIKEKKEQVIMVKQNEQKSDYESQYKQKPKKVIKMQIPNYTKYQKFLIKLKNII